MSVHKAPRHLFAIASPCDPDILNQIQEEYGENTTAFMLMVPTKRLEVSWDKAYNEVGGILWGIDLRDGKTVLFDAARHGYNGQFDLFDGGDIEDVRDIELLGAPSERALIIVFQYGGDETEYAKECSSENPEDFFDWIVVYERIGKVLRKVYEFECA